MSSAVRTKEQVAQLISFILKDSFHILWLQRKIFIFISTIFNSIFMWLHGQSVQTDISTNCHVSSEKLAVGLPSPAKCFPVLNTSEIWGSMWNSSRPNPSEPPEGDGS